MSCEKGGKGASNISRNLRGTTVNPPDEIQNIQSGQASPFILLSRNNPISVCCLFWYGGCLVSLLLLPAQNIQFPLRHRLRQRIILTPRWTLIRSRSEFFCHSRFCGQDPPPPNKKKPRNFLRVRPLVVRLHESRQM